MQPSTDPGYTVCYLDVRRSVPVSLETSPFQPAPSVRTTPGWFAWARTTLAVAVVLVLVALGGANIALYARWHEVEDGVLWGARAEGVTALEIAPESAAAAAGIRRGDVLLAVNGSPVETAADVVQYQHRSRAGTRLAYT